MSIASPFESNSTGLGRRIGQSVTVLAPAVRFAGFWLAVLLPFVLASLLVTGAVGDRPIAVGALLGLNVLGLAVGRDYKR